MNPSAKTPWQLRFAFKAACRSGLRPTCSNVYLYASNSGCTPRQASLPIPSCSFSTTELNPHHGLENSLLFLRDLPCRGATFATSSALKKNWHNPGDVSRMLGHDALPIVKFGWQAQERQDDARALCGHDPMRVATAPLLQRLLDLLSCQNNRARLKSLGKQLSISENETFVRGCTSTICALCQHKQLAAAESPCPCQAVGARRPSSGYTSTASHARFPQRRGVLEVSGPLPLGMQLGAD